MDAGSPRPPAPDGAKGSICVGIDVQGTGEVDDAVRQWGRRYLDRVFSVGEQAWCLAHQGDRHRVAAHLARRFAAKEAVLKALRYENAVTWTDIEVDGRCEGGPQTVRLHGGVALRCRDLDLERLDLSISTGPGFAIAIVIAGSGWCTS